MNDLVTDDRHTRRGGARRTKRAGRLAAGASGAAALAHYLPSVCVLGQWSPVPLRALPSGWCRWRGPADRPLVCLTLDDGPSPESTAATLDLLDRLALRATFFVLGSQARAHPELVADMVARGHSVGSHGFHHEHHLLRSPGWIARDMAASVEAVTDAAGTRPRFYRPTYGQLTARTILEARRHDMEVVLWSAWGHEWTESEADPVVRRLTRRIDPGAILLLHDNEVSCPPGTTAVVHQTLELLADELQRRQLRAVTLDELLEQPAARQIA